MGERMHPIQFANIREGVGMMCITGVRSYVAGIDRGDSFALQRRDIPALNSFIALFQLLHSVVLLDLR